MNDKTLAEPLISYEEFMKLSVKLSAATAQMEKISQALKICDTGHQDDCADADDEFNENETCECGYITIERTIAQYEQFKKDLST